MFFSHKFNDVQLIIVVYFLFLLSFLLLAYAETFYLLNFVKFTKSNIIIMLQDLTMYICLC